MVKAKDQMTDVVGIVQHHDGVTGTGKQHVANDYAKRVFKGIEATNTVYADIIKRLASTAGVNAQDWTWCRRQNGTWQDCPIASYSSDFTMVVATHNPSNLALKTIELKVPHGNFIVEQFVVTLW
jgi:lysosomal alpha-mannosidase